MVHVQYKRCSMCKEEKSRDQFYSRIDREIGVTSYCKDCGRENAKKKHDYQKNREKNLRQRYNLSWDMYLDMLADQHGKCPICMNDLDMDPDCPRSGLAPVVDHDHDTGRVRAILCADCNRGIGMFKENPDALWAAARYVIEHNAEVIYVSREDTGD